jgi:uncharacterized membrane protein YgdD (TMEM256/DUF423 family)
MKKALWRFAAVSGVVAVILSATASHTGEDLIYTIPVAIIGCLLFLMGAVQAHRLKADQPTTIHTASTAYRLGYRRK